MSWLSTLFNGNSSVNKAATGLTSTGSQLTGAGQADTGAASNFFQNILNGGASKVLAPQISSIQKQGQQQLQTLSQFGNRSGGTNAAAQQVGSNTNANINDLIASLTGSSAQSLGSLGTNLLNIGSNDTLGGAQLTLQNKSMFDQLLASIGQGAGSAATKSLFS